MSDTIKIRGIDGRALKGREITGREIGMRAQGGGKPSSSTPTVVSVKRNVILVMRAG